MYFISAISRPFDQLVAGCHELHESNINDLVNSCDTFTQIDEKNINYIIETLVQRNLFYPASQLASKITNNGTKTSHILRIHKGIAEYLESSGFCRDEAKILKKLNGRSPDWGRYSSIFQRLLKTNQFWAAKGLIPLTDNSLRSHYVTLFSQRLAQLGHVAGAISMNPSFSAKGVYVGELQERWQFPSDHLPVGITYQGSHFFSWNVLDSRYIHWMRSMGLDRSLIVQEHDSAYDRKNPTLTRRDERVVDQILSAIEHPTHPRSILALQECSIPFIAHLRERIPSRFQLISYGENVFIIDKDKFEYEPTGNSVIFGTFSSKPEVALLDIRVRRLEDDTIIRLINVHVPGNPEILSHFELATYLHNTLDPTITTFVMGDMNFNELEMSEALEHAFEEFGSSPFLIYAPYCTNIAPNTFMSKAIDHFLVYFNSEAYAEGNSPNEVLSGVNDLVNLLSKECVIER